MDEHPIRAVLTAYCQGSWLSMAPVLIQTNMVMGITVTSNPDPAELQGLVVTSWPHMVPWKQGSSHRWFSEPTNKE